MTASRASTPATETTRVSVGISSCLLGESVRFDGNHKRNAYICDVLGQWFDWVPQCPETAIGLGVPREPIHLRRIGDGIRIVGVRSPELDVTDELVAHARRFAAGQTELDGYIFKKDSPSCGLERVRVYDADGANATRDGAGGFAAELRRLYPRLPMEEEGRLGDPRLRENFVQRVFVHHRWRRLLRDGLTPAALIDFHASHKLLLMAHDPQAYRRLGRMVARAGDGALDTLGDEYFQALMEALSTPASNGRHANVLQHIAGYFRQVLDASDRAELAELIEAYRVGLVPLVVPITLLNHHLRRHPQPYVQRQVYLEPYPPELRLRNV
ncbi:YbgA family protein [Acidihalobacter prosperus]